MNTPANGFPRLVPKPPVDRFNEWLKRWLPALIWAVVIWVLSTSVFGDAHTSRFILPLLHWLFPALPQGELLSWHHVIRKVAHVAVYFVFSLLISRAVRLGHPGSRWRFALVAVALVAAYATVDEIHQSFVPGRTAAVEDVALDVVGGAAAQVVAGLLAFWWGGRRRDAGLGSKPE
jgi:VanZ family protein